MVAKFDEKIGEVQSTVKGTPGLGKSMAKAIERGGEQFDASTEALLDAAGMKA